MLKITSSNQERGQIATLGAVGLLIIAFLFTLTGGGPGMKSSEKAERRTRGADIVLAFDTSGSMEFETLCYGCFVPTANAYPQGNYYPLPWNSAAVGGSAAHCSQTGDPIYYDTNGITHTYLILEAEEYSTINYTYDPETYTPGLTYWALQRNGSQTPSYMGNSRALGRDGYGAYLEHHPYRIHVNADGEGSNCTWANLLDGFMCYRDSWITALGGPFPTPRVDYSFTVPTTGTWYVWVRGQGGDGANNLMWGLNMTPLGNVSGFGDTAYNYNGADPYGWEWQSMGSLTALSATQTYTLNLWAGAADFSIDRIILTNDSQNPGVISSGSAFDLAVLKNTSAIDNHRSGMACDPCDARFGGYPTADGMTTPRCNDSSIPEARRDRRKDPLYDDEQSIRGAIEGFKAFALRLNLQHDQVGLVSYNSTAAINHELLCLQSQGAACAPAVITNTIITTLDNLHASGSTNIADTIRLSTDVLSDTNGHYGRPEATKAIVIITDGETNQILNLDPVCYAQDYWPYNTGDSNRDRSKDCTVYYAMQARDHGIAVYSITMKGRADQELMQYIAELTGGFHRHAPTQTQLDPILKEINRFIHYRLQD